MTSDSNADAPDRANISNRHPQGGEQGSHRPTQTQERPNISTEHQDRATCAGRAISSIAGNRAPGKATTRPR